MREIGNLLSHCTSLRRQKGFRTWRSIHGAIMDKNRAELDAVYRASIFLSAIDLILATICAAAGNIHFVAFIVLAIGMWAYGTWIKATADTIGE